MKIDFKKTLFSLVLGALFCLIASPIYAGGGALQPINFADSQQITGKSFSPVVALKDPNSNYTTGLVGKEVLFQAHTDLNGAQCTTTQRLSDDQGQVKADCKADTYGNFSFDIIDAQNSGNMGTFTVSFTENGTGFSDQGSTGTYTISIPKGNFGATVSAPFQLEAALKKDGQLTTNYDAVNYLRWDVLAGSIISLSSDETKNRVVTFKTTDLGQMTLRVTAVMNDGSLVQSGAIVITTTSTPVQVAPITVQSNSSSTVVTPSPTPSTKPKTSPEPLIKEETPLISTKVASTSTESTEKLAQQVVTLQDQLNTQQKQINVLQIIVKNITSFFSKMFGRK